MRLRASRKKVQRQRAFDDVAFDLGGPGPIEVGHGLEALDAAEAQTPLQAAARAFGGFCLGELLRGSDEADQRALVARAMKSSSCVGRAHKPICWS